jgi:hypothetical protein
MSELLTGTEVARLLCGDGVTVRRWAKEGTLEAVLLPNVDGKSATLHRRSWRITNLDQIGLRVHHLSGDTLFPEICRIYKVFNPSFDLLRILY